MGKAIMLGIHCPLLNVPALGLLPLLSWHFGWAIKERKLPPKTMVVGASTPLAPSSSRRRFIVHQRKMSMVVPSTLVARRERLSKSTGKPFILPAKTPSFPILTLTVTTSQLPPTSY